MGFFGVLSERPAQSVRNGPGSTMTTLMPSGATSFDSASEQPFDREFGRGVIARARESR